MEIKITPDGQESSYIIPTADGLRSVFNRIVLQSTLSDSIFEQVFTHEWLHAMGLGDAYLTTDFEDTIMATASYKAKMQIDDLKMLASLYTNAQNESELKSVESLINNYTFKYSFNNNDNNAKLSEWQEKLAKEDVISYLDKQGYEYSDDWEFNFDLKKELYTKQVGENIAPKKSKLKLDLNCYDNLTGRVENYNYQLATSESTNIIKYSSTYNAKENAMGLVNEKYHFGVNELYFQFGDYLMTLYSFNGDQPILGAEQIITQSEFLCLKSNAEKLENCTNQQILSNLKRNGLNKTFSSDEKTNDLLNKTYEENNNEREK